MNRFQAFKQAARIRGDHAAMLTELEALYEREQALRPVDVVEQARDEASALHTHFQWDDQVAAEAYRLRQAGDIIRAVVTVRVDEATEKATQVRALVSVSMDESADEDEPTRVYVATEEAIRRPDLARQVFEQIRRDIDAFERKWTHIEELAGVRQAMRQWREQHQQMELALN